MATPNKAAGTVYDEKEYFESMGIKDAPLGKIPAPTMDIPGQSSQIDQLAAALSKAQGDIKGAKKDSENPFFHSGYADLASVWDACRAQLSKWELAVIQRPTCRFIGEPKPYTWTSKGGEEREGIKMPTEVMVTTILAHSSGQWISGTMSCMLPDADPQKVGSATTYLRRYGLQAFVGIAPEDDDAEQASGRSGKPAPSGPVPPCPVCSNIGKVSQWAKKGSEFFCGKCKKPYGAHNAMMAAEPGDEPPF